MLAYHRVGDRGAATFDPWVFTADQTQLEAHVRYFQKHHRIVGLDEALEIVSSPRKLRGNAILITFDDGYIDNHDVAVPLLKSLGVEAVFFLVSDFLNGQSLAWWDRIAWLVQSARERCFRLPVGETETVVDLRAAAPEAAVSAVLELYKTCPAALAQRFEAALEMADRVEKEPPAERLFLGPQEARAIGACGMRIGAHTHTHPILARLSPEAQFEELSLCRGILERQTGSTVDVLAYPVGGPADFDRTTQALAADCGYRAAFSCHGGVNAPGRSNLYDIKRTAVYWGAQAEHLLEP